MKPNLFGWYEKKLPNGDFILFYFFHYLAIYDVRPELKSGYFIEYIYTESI